MINSILACSCLNAFFQYSHPQGELTSPSLSALDSPVLRPQSPSSFTHSSPSPAADPESEPSEMGNTISASLAGQFQNLSLDSDRRFFTMSLYVTLPLAAHHVIVVNFDSPLMLVQHAAEMKKEVMGDGSPITAGNFGRPLFWEFRPVSRSMSRHTRANSSPVGTCILRGRLPTFIHLSRSRPLASPC